MPKQYTDRAKLARGEKVTVTSGDRKNFAMVPNHVIRGASKPNELAVLMVIASYAWQGSECTIGLATIVREAKVNRHTAIEAVRAWRERGVIEVEVVEGVGQKIRTMFDFTTDVAAWAPVLRGARVPVPRQVRVPVPREAPKEEEENKTKKKETFAADAAEPVEPEAPFINAVLEAFQKSGLNPGINYGNVTERKAAAWLVKEYGLEKVQAIVAYAARVAGERYAPVVATPLQLKAKVGILAAYAKRQKNERAGGVFVIS